MMRTTLTIDDDVAKELERLQRRHKRPFKQVINDALRAGLLQLGQSPEPRRVRSVTEPVSLGTPRMNSVDNISEVLALLEGDAHR